MTIDTGQLNEFLGRFVGDLGATMAAGTVVIGHRLGLYRALAGGPARAGELAERTQTSPRYLEEWLRGQAAHGYVDYDPATGMDRNVCRNQDQCGPDAGGHPRLSKTPRSGLNRDRTHRGQKMAPLQRKSMASLSARSKE